MTTPGNPAIVPMPPMATRVGLPWDVALDDPIAALAEARRSLGDTFVVDSGEDRYLFTFSPAGVKAFYALPEDRASKGVADWRMLRRKLPDQIFVGRRTLPHQLFGRDDVADYLTNVELGLETTIAELGGAREAEVFGLTRRLGHRVGLASWGGPGSAYGDRFDRLCRAFDTLDGADSFVHPDAMSAVAASEKSAEIAALAVVTDELGASLDDLGGQEVDHPLFSRIAEVWQDAPPSERREGVAMDVALIHIASMSNLFAALGWVIIDLLTHPDELAEVRAGDRAVAEMCALESTRLAQRSIMSRYVLKPVTLETGNQLPPCCPRGHDRNLAPSDQYERKPWTRHLGSEPLEPPALGRPLVARRRGAGDRVRARQAHLSGSAVLALGHDDCGGPPTGCIRLRAGLGRPASTGSGSDWRCGPLRRSLSDPLLPTFRSSTSVDLDGSSPRGRQVDDSVRDAPSMRRHDWRRLGWRRPDLFPGRRSRPLPPSPASPT